MTDFIDTFPVLVAFDNLYMLENIQIAKEVLNGHSGIYAFVHTPTGTSYIGSSVDLYGRIMDHINGHSSNQHLQYAIAKYGLSSFAFVILQYCKSSDLLKLEQYFLDILFSLTTNLRYNFARFAEAPFKGLTHTPESKAQMSALWGFNNNTMFGRTHTPESKAQMSEAHKGKTHSPETRAQMSDSISGTNNPMYGRTGTLNPMYGIVPTNAMTINVYSEVDNQLVRSFSSQVAVAKWLGVSRGTVQNYIKSGKVWNNLYIFRISS